MGTGVRRTHLGPNAPLLISWGMAAPLGLVCWFLQRDQTSEEELAVCPGDLGTSEEAGEHWAFMISDSLCLSLSLDFPIC